MSARDELLEIVMRDNVSSGGDAVWANDLLDAFAHELAEKIRDEIKDPNPLASLFEPFAGALAADLIDPEVTS